MLELGRQRNSPWFVLSPVGGFEMRSCESRVVFKVILEAEDQR